MLTIQAFLPRSPLNIMNAHILRLPIFTLLLLSSLCFADETEFLFTSSPDISKEEINSVLQIAKQKNAGKVISITQESESSEKAYRVKVLSKSGRLKTYFVNQAITEMNP